jgi:hypothetical protein
MMHGWLNIFSTSPPLAEINIVLKKLNCGVMLGPRLARKFHLVRKLSPE